MTPRDYREARWFASHLIAVIAILASVGIIIWTAVSR